jgi:hypothetical protein
VAEDEDRFTLGEAKVGLGQADSSRNQAPETTRLQPLNL